MFKNKQLNLILNAMLNNNQCAKICFSEFMSRLPDEIWDIVCECQSVEYSGDDYEVCAYFAPNCVQIEIYYHNSYLRIDMCPIRSRQLKDIPFDQEHDIFLDDERNLDSPAFFDLIYNPNVDLYETSIETPDIGYFIVEQREKDGFNGYHLISQSLDDAGIHNTKIDIENFIYDDPNEQFVNSIENEVDPVQEAVVHASRRAPHPRHC